MNAREGYDKIDALNWSHARRFCAVPFTSRITRGTEAGDAMQC